MLKPVKRPEGASAVLVLDDGSVFWGFGFGAEGSAVGEICFTTGTCGYQETLTDPSFAGQIITFTTPHIGNVGVNLQDVEAASPLARGLITRELPTESQNWRAETNFGSWLADHNMIGLAGIDTRALTQHIRDRGAPKGVIAFAMSGKFDLESLLAQAKEWAGLDGMDLALEAGCRQRYSWNEAAWVWPHGHGQSTQAGKHIVAIDYGAKRNILRMLAANNNKVTVVPPDTSAESILALRPDGIFLSNGPGDPAATGAYAVPVIQNLLQQKDLPIFGICLGHQLLALALGGKTTKMPLGHRGANHPVKDIQTGKVEITSQNHGFHVLAETLPETVEATHISLFDNSNEGLRVRDAPVFSVQYHPEASPGPHDSHYLFERFFGLINRQNQKAHTS